jgi:hypothetical protein
LRVLNVEPGGVAEPSTPSIENKTDTDDANTELDGDVFEGGQTHPSASNSAFKSKRVLDAMMDALRTASYEGFGEDYGENAEVSLYNPHLIAQPNFRDISRSPRRAARCFYFICIYFRCIKTSFLTNISEEG